jgi:hypothetical protein
MIKFNNLILGLILVFIFTACEKNDNDDFSNDIEYVKYGTSFGECLGYCKNDITVTNTTIDFNKRGWDLEGLLPEMSNTESVDAKYTTELIDKINFDSFLELDSIIGCPDCADGGAEWIEIRSKGISHKVIFEYRNEPSETKEYIGYLRTYINAFQIDSNETIDFNERTIINQQGFIKNFVATRGSYQWLIGIINGNDTTYYFDKYLDTEYQQDNLKIEFKGVIDFDSTMINKPAPNDIPIPDFKAQNIRTFDIKPIDD